jgi:hypothetical protein
MNDANVSLSKLKFHKCTVVQLRLRELMNAHLYCTDVKIISVSSSPLKFLPEFLYNGDLAHGFPLLP